MRNGLFAPKVSRLATWNSFTRTSLGAVSRNTSDTVRVGLTQLANRTSVLFSAQPPGRVGSMGIHHAQLACPAGSEDTLRAFYRDLLGLAEKAKPPSLAARGG